MEYVCNNPECPSFGKREYYSREIYVITKDGTVGKNAPCPHCGKIREEINPNAQIPLSEKNVSMNFFNGMSMEQKREMLKKRSHQDYLKNIKEKKDATIERAKGEMREMRRK